MTKILFVCLGNICRSPAAEAIMQSIIDKAQANKFFRLDSAGTSACHAGAPADKRMISSAHMRGILIPSISRQFLVNDFKRFDLIVTMDQSNYHNVVQLDKDQEFSSKVMMLTEFASGKFAHFDHVPDPYYGGQDGFELVLDLLTNCCENLFKDIQAKNTVRR